MAKMKVKYDRFRNGSTPFWHCKLTSRVAPLKCSKLRSSCSPENLYCDAIYMDNFFNSFFHRFKETLRRLVLLGRKMFVLLNGRSSMENNHRKRDKTGSWPSKRVVRVAKVGAGKQDRFLGNHSPGTGEP